jgi:hypothetical protein
LDITVAIWKTYEENPQDFLEATNKHSGLTFETVLPGGFGTCSFKVGVGGWNAVHWYRDYVGKHVVLFDHLDRRLYEGRIASTDAEGDGVSVSVEGYYAHAGDLIDGLIYPIDTPTSISQVIIDAVSLTSEWSHDISMIKTTVTDITPQDFTGGKKIADAIQTVLKTGDDGLTPVPLYFAIWDYRRAFLFAEKQPTDIPDWQVFTKDFGGQSGLSLSRSRQSLYNKIQVLYDDPDIGQTFTDWYEDSLSQSLFGVREGTMNIGSSDSGTAAIIAALALKAYAYPIQSSKLGISGRVYSIAGAPDFPYMVRAGTLIRVNDYDPTVSQLVSGQGGMDAAVAFITRTNYTADDNTLQVELGTAGYALDIELARIGASSGSIQ